MKSFLILCLSVLRMESFSSPPSPATDNEKFKFSQFDVSTHKKTTTPKHITFVVRAFVRAVIRQSSPRGENPRRVLGDSFSVNVAIVVCRCRV